MTVSQCIVSSLTVTCYGMRQSQSAGSVLHWITDGFSCLVLLFVLCLRAPGFQEGRAVVVVLVAVVIHLRSDGPIGIRAKKIETR